MAVYPFWVTLSHLTFCLYNNYIMYTQKVKYYFEKNLTKVGGCETHPPTYPNEKYRWVVFPDPWVRVRFTQSPPKAKG